MSVDRELELEQTALAIAHGEYDAGAAVRTVGYWEYYDTNRDRFLRSARVHLRMIDDAKARARR